MPTPDPDDPHDYRCDDCGCSMHDHDALEHGGGCTSCGDCEGYR